MKFQFYKILFIVTFLHNYLICQTPEVSLSSSSSGQTFNTCQTLFLDSGGQGSEYSNNEDFTITICPDNPDDVISIFFTVFDLDPTDEIAGPNSNADRVLIYDGPNTSATNVGNGGGNEYFQYIFKATPINTSGCITLRFISNGVGTGDFSFLATCTTPCSDPIAGGRILNGITNDSIRVCIGEPIQFEEFNSFAQPGFNLQNYSWDFADGQTANGLNVSHSFSEGGYYKVQLFVTDDNGCTNNNLIDLQVLVATKPNFDEFMSDTTICIGESLNLTATPLLYENTWTSGLGSVEVDDGCLYDSLTGISQDIALLQTNFISGVTITDISQIENICFEMEHTYIGDLIITLYCPNGQSTILHQQGGAGVYLGEAIDDDVAEINCDDPSTIGVPYSYCFSIDATETWVDYADNNLISGDILPSGSYAPIENLNQLIGCPANGVWTLSVIDNFGADDGKVFSFQLDLADELYAEIISFTPEHSTSSDSSYWHFSTAAYATSISQDADQMTITPTAPGTYNYFYSVLNDFGCINDTSVTVSVFQVELPFELVDAQTCSGTEFPVGANFQPCNFTLKLIDSFGDSWNDNTLTVSVNNGSNITYTVLDTDNGGDFIDIPITLTQGDEISFTFNNIGNFDYECSYQLIDCNGNVLFQDGGNGNAPQTTTVNYIVNMQLGAEGYSFQWSPASIFDNPSISNPNATITQNTTITMNYFPDDHPACVVSDQMEAIIIPDSYAGMDAVIDTCVNFETIDLSTFLGPNYAVPGVWTNPSGSVVSMPINLTTSPQGVYTYSVGNGTCSDEALVTNLIKSEPNIQTNYTTDPDICIGESSIFTNNNTLQNLQSIQILMGDTSSMKDITLDYNIINYTYPYIGTFDLLVNMTSINGCQYQDFYDNIVTVHPYPEANFSYTPENVTILDPNLIVTDESSLGVVSYYWEFEGALNPFSNKSSENVNYPFQEGLYPITLYIEDGVGCRDSITKMIKVSQVPLIYFPNSFSPNNDENNQTWKIITSGIYLNNFNIKIYNRWGQVIFETRDPEIGWDGTYNNVPVQSGIYTWKLEAVDITTNETIEKNGFINLIR